MENKILEIAKDKDVKHTRYCSLNYTVGTDAMIFESNSELKLKPLQVAKKWAKEKGYTHLTVISLTLKKSDKIYTL